MKIMTISDSPTIQTGMARVHRKVIDALAGAGHSVLPCGWFAYEAEILDKIKSGEKGPPVYYESTSGQIRILPVPKGNGMNCMYASYDAIGMFQPDIVVTLGDHWDFFYMTALKLKTGFSFKWVPWLNIEQDTIEKKWRCLLQYADSILVPSAYGRDVLGKAGFMAEMIPYGIEPAFQRFPAERRESLRVARGCQDKLRFITVGQNTWRKNFPALLQAIRIIKDFDKDGKVCFYIHTNTSAEDPQETCLYNLPEIAEKLDIADRVSFPDDVSVYSCCNDEKLAEEYNASDFYVSTSTAEGYGFPICESMACGLPALANRTSAVIEHVEGRGILVDGRMDVYPPSRLVSVAIPGEIAKGIVEMCHWAGVSLYGEDVGKKGDLQGMRSLCEEYGKGKVWSSSQRSFLAALERTMAGQRIPVEEL